MLAVRGIEAKPESLRGKVYIPGKKGSLTTEMVARARRYGMLVYTLQPDLTDILLEVSAGNPVLVMQNLGFDWMPRWHFSVVAGFDLEREFVVLRSGNTLYREIGFDLFLKTWDRAQHWAVVMMPPGQLPTTASEARYVIAAHELEQVGELTAAMKAYETAISRWPGSEKANFGGGNTAYALGDFERARSLYSNYVELRPEAAEGWNNLAYSLMKVGCRDESLKAMQCALQLAPDNGNYLESQREIASQPQSTAVKACQMPRC